MLQLSPKHIENCSREISRWAKAVRLIHSLERNLLSKGFPEPDLIEPGRKPFDLRISWQAENPGHSAKLRKCITTALTTATADEGPWIWQDEVKGYLGLRGRFRLGKKTTVYLRLLVADGRKPSEANGWFREERFSKPDRFSAC